VSADIQTSSQELVEQAGGTFVNKPFDRQDILKALAIALEGTA
jgi:hypothetical protein